MDARRFPKVWVLCIALIVVVLAVALRERIFSTSFSDAGLPPVTAGGRSGPAPSPPPGTAAIGPEATASASALPTLQSLADKPFDEVRESLQALADAGDVAAASRLGRTYLRCAGWAEATPDALVELMAWFLEFGNAVSKDQASARSAETVSILLEARADTRDLCDGATIEVQSARAQALPLLEFAAARGDVAAMTAYADALRASVTGREDALARAAQLREQRGRAALWLSAALAAGDPQAALALGMGHATGFPVARDPALAIAYVEAYLSRATVGPATEQALRRQVSTWRASLSPTDVARAADVAGQLADCCGSRP